jgi:predicted secreted hydrolase
MSAPGWGRGSGSRWVVAFVRLAVVVTVVSGGGPLAGCRRRRPFTEEVPGSSGAALSATALLGGGDDVEGFDRALAPVPLELPRDHGPHPRFRNEWWYFTGILESEAEAPARRRFGYQLTIFRQSLDPHPVRRGSAWATANIYMGHLAISDLDGDPRRPRFHAYQRFARDGLGLAGARGVPFEVWVDDWRAAGPATGEASFPMALRARAAVGDQPSGAADAGSVPAAALELVVGAGRGPILQGDRGLSQKGPRPGVASYYHSFTRLPTRGTLTVGGQPFAVSGASWLDREWSTGALDAAVIGWDWLGAQLDDGRDVMVYRLRMSGGADAAQSRATLIDADGRTRLFGPESFTFSPVGQWQSADRRARYPAAMRLRIPAATVDLAITPMLADQELALAIRYWEGAVAVTGVEGGQAVSGSGYLELTGYAAPRDR